MRYVELNAVRARIVKHAEDHRWSSTRAHLGLEATPTWLDTEHFESRWPTAQHWQETLTTLSRAETAAIRQATRHDAVLGSDSFIQNLEQTYSVQLRAKPLGRPRKPPSAAPYSAESLEIQSAG